MVIYREACHAGSMLVELPTLHNVYAVAACTPDESSYACFHDKRRNAFLADVFTAYWLHHTKSKNLMMSTFEDQFNYMKRKVQENVTEWGVSQTPCRHGNKIAQRCTADGGSRALSERCEATRLYELKVVAERFRTTIFNWDEEAFVVTRSHLQVLVNLCECGLEVQSITAAIDYVGQRIRF
ncbi:hypothetical protein HF521_020996 [Silurus meridionalis]|uniref:Uncharacterized protein n=1 Tax=Silurus meridionalis TaxID=175797 RepID=A0A8T0BK02_SILME|nr:hypothetical protein HF521_020996 [Silurus meridionalis]